MTVSSPEPSLRKFTLGYARVPNQLIRHLHNFSPAAWGVFLVISSYRRAYPSYNVFQHQTGLSRGSIAKGIRELRDANVIEYTRGGRHGLANLYRVLPIEEWLLVPKKFTEETSIGSHEEPPDTTPETISSSPSGRTSVQSLDTSKQSKNPKNKTTSITEDQDGDEFFLERPEDTSQRPLTSRQRSVKGFYHQLQEAFDSAKFLSLVMTTIESGLNTFGDDLVLTDLKRIVEQNTNGKREPFRQKLIEGVENLYYSVMDKFEQERSDDERDKRLEELEAEIEAGTYSRKKKS